MSRLQTEALISDYGQDSVTDSDEDTQLEFGGVAIVNKPHKYLSPRSINAHPRMGGMKRNDFDSIQQIKESEVSVHSRESLDEVEAYLSIDGSCTNELFGTPEIQALPLASPCKTSTRFFTVK